VALDWQLYIAHNNMGTRRSRTAIQHIQQRVRLSSQMKNIKSQTRNKTQYHSKNDLRHPRHPSLDRFQPDRTILRQDRAVRPTIKPDAQASFGFVDEGFGILPAHI